MKRFGIILGISLSALPAFAEVSAVLSPHSGVTNEEFVLDVTATEGEGEPNFERSKDISIERVGTSTQVSIVNGVTTSSVTYRYRVIPRDDLAPGEYPLPPGKTENGAEVPSQTLTIEKTSSPQVKRSEGLAYVQIVDNLEPYVGEQITYRAEIASSLPLQGAGIEEEEFRGFLKESYGKERSLIRNISGSNTKVISIREALYPNQSGTLRIPPRGIEVQVQIPDRNQPGRNWSLFDDVFGVLRDPLRVETRKLSADGLTLQVKPLPPPPVTGYIPVGRIRVTSSLDKKSIPEGEGVTVVVQVEGDGNLRPVELATDELKDFEIYPEEPTVEVFIESDRLVQKKRFVLALVPKITGDVVIPSIPITYFDPKVGKYLRAPTDRYLINVIPDPSKPQTKPQRTETPESAPKVAPPIVSGELRPAVVVPVDSVAKVPDSLRLALLILSPLVACFLLFCRYRINSRDPQEARKREAFRAASALLGETPEQCGEALRRYLSDHYGRAMAGLTAKESGVLLKELGAPDEVAELLREIEQSTFAPKSAGGNLGANNYRERCEKLMRQLEGR